MKRTSAVLLSVILCVSFCISAFASAADAAQNAGTLFTDDLFSVVVAKGYSYTGTDEDGIYMFKADDGSSNSVGINFLANTTNESFAGYSEETLNAFAEQMAAAVEKSYADSNIQADYNILDRKITTSYEGWNVLCYTSETVFSDNGENSHFYQKQAEYAGEQYMYCVTFTTDNAEDLDSVDYMLFSFKPAESENKDPAVPEIISPQTSSNTILYGAIRGAVIGACVGGLVAVVLVVIKKKKGKTESSPTFSTSAAPAQPQQDIPASAEAPADTASEPEASSETTDE